MRYKIVSLFLTTLLIFGSLSVAEAAGGYRHCDHHKRIIAHSTRQGHNYGWQSSNPPSRTTHRHYVGVWNFGSHGKTLSFWTPVVCKGKVHN